MTSAGTGSAIVTSFAGGIYCGQTCSAIYNNGSWVTLTDNPATTSVFTGCSGAYKVLWIAGRPHDGRRLDGQVETRVGVFRPSTATWYFDINGDGDLDSCTKANKIDACTKSFGKSGDLPVVEDWKGKGKTRIGVFRPSTGQWFLDKKGNSKRDDCSLDECATSFRLPEDLPAAADWNDNGKDKIGIFRPSRGEWLLDFNGNEKGDGCGVDLCLGPFSKAGDLPVLGRWYGTRQQCWFRHSVPRSR